MNREAAVRAYALVMMATALGLVSPGLAAEIETSVDLNDFDWTIGEVRSAVSVERQVPGCTSLTKGAVKEFRPEEGTLSIVKVTLKAKKAGRLALIPELILARDGGVYGVYRLCHGVRVLDPKPHSGSEAFLPPCDGRQWPGHDGWLAVASGQSVVVELVFTHVEGKVAEILAASPAAALRGSQQ